MDATAGMRHRTPRWMWQRVAARPSHQPSAAALPPRPANGRVTFVTVTTIVVLLSLYQLAYPVHEMATDPLSAGGYILGTLALVLLVALYVVVLIDLLRGQPWRRRLRPWSIAGFAGYLFLPPIFGLWWTSLVMFPLFCVLMTLRGRTRIFVSVAGVLIYLAVALPLVPRDEWIEFLAQFAVTTLFLLVGPVLLILIRQLDHSRTELADMAVSNERLRVARDLHDTLGHSLSVAHLKLELAERISTRDPVRAGVELGEARELLHTSMTEMQAVVAGLRDSSVSAEAEGAASILRAAGIDVQIAVDDQQMSEQVAEVMAWVIREGTTNVLRHSDAVHCEIHLRQRGGRAELVFANDGPPLASPRTPSGGRGLTGLRERLAELGGELTMRSNRGGGFILVASAPRWAESVGLVGG